jgi:predicted permease
LANWNGISPDYFKTLGIPLLRGRDFSWSDDEKAPPRVIVSQTLAQRYWPNENPIGRHLTYARREVVAEIIGVAADVKGRSLDTDAGLIFYTPYSQFAWPGISLTVRTAGDPHAFFRTVPAQIFAQDRNLPVVNIQTTEDLVNQTVSQQRQTVYVITGFAAVALLLAMIGLYGAMAYSVAQRTMELGIRQAIGAQRSDVLGMILAQGLRLAVGGIVLGVISAAVFTRLLSGLLFHVSATDPLTYGGVCALLLVVSLAASCLPAWRAARVDPLEALRAR